MNGWRTQVASDVGRDGLGMELLNGAGDVVAEVFRCDADKSVIVTTFGNDIPLTVVEWFLERARASLEAFEDGTPLPKRSDSKAANEQG